MSTIRFRLCSGADPETLRREWERPQRQRCGRDSISPLDGEAEHSGAPRRNPLHPWTSQRRFQPAGSSRGNFQVETGDNVSLGGSQPLCGHHPGTSPLPLTPGAAGAPTNPSTPNTLLPPPRGGTVRLRALCASFFADEETEPQKGIDTFPMAHGWSGLRLSREPNSKPSVSTGRDPGHPQPNQSTPIFVCFVFSIKLRFL